METVVILLSDKRSGSTMFQNEICKHPDIQTVIYSPHTYLETHHWLKGAVMLGKSNYSGYGSKANARIYLIDCIQKNVPDFIIPSDDRELIFQGWNAICTKFAQPVFFEKSPQLLGDQAGLELMMEWIRDTNFNVKVIGLTRNPLAVLYSAYRLFHTDPEKRQFSWLRTQQNLLQVKEQLNDNQYLQIRYEDIILNPVSAFNNIFRFIGVPLKKSIEIKVHDESLTKWYNDQFFTLQLDEKVNQFACQLGYRGAELTNPFKSKPFFLKRWSRQLQGKIKLIIARISYRYFKPFKIKFEKLHKVDKR
ncbi:MAG: hypothetical protein ACI8TA_003126 [Cyclobacteriaceae bacterium]|jgi:hypothetical protein